MTTQKQSVPPRERSGVMQYDLETDRTTIVRYEGPFSAGAEVWSYELPRELNHAAALIANAPPPYQPILDNAIDRFKAALDVADQDTMDRATFEGADDALEEITDLLVSMAHALTTGATIVAAVSIERGHP